MEDSMVSPFLKSMIKYTAQGPGKNDDPYGMGRPSHGVVE